MMIKKYNFLARVKNNTGSTVLMVLAISAIIAIGIGFLADRLQVQRKLSADLNTSVSYTIAVQSVTDFARHALKQKWCFDGSPGQYDFNPGDGTNCAGNYTHPHSTLRLTLPYKFARKLVQYKFDYPTLVSGTFPALTGTQLDQQAQAMILPNFEISGPVAGMPDSHPLKQILAAAKGKQPIVSVRIKYEIVSDINLPSTGDEVYVRITTALLDSGGNIIQNGSFKASETDLIYVSPRELNYFSLVLRGNMILNQTANDESATSGAGNAFVPSGANAAGLSFYGPVYIQKNLILPAANAPKSQVTFYEPVTFGSGYIAQASSLGNQGFKAPVALGASKEWSDTNLFGGFLKGFETDSAGDPGFDALAGMTANAQTNNALMLHCLDRIREQNSPNLTLGSQLFASLTSPADSAQGPGLVTRTYRVGFLKNTITGMQKRFKRQLSVSPAPPILKTGPVGVLSVPDITVPPKNIISAEILGTSANDSRTVSIMVNVGFNGWNLENIPVPDGTSTNPGVTRISLKKTDADGDSAKLLIKVADVLINGVSQPHLRDVTVEITDAGKLSAPPPIGDKPITYVKIIGMDNTCNNGVCQTGGSLEFKSFYLRKFTNFTNDGVTPPATTNLCDPTKLYTQLSYAAQPECSNTAALNTVLSIPPGYAQPNGIEDIGTRDQQCQSAGNTNLANYNASQTEQYFSDHSSDGWEFTAGHTPTIVGSEKIYPPLTFSNFNSTSVESVSISGNCIVPSNVVRVVGNYVCQKLIIRSRTQRLQMIGTFIVIDKLYIHPNAQMYGIDFYSIHSPAAVNILKDAQVLKTAGGQSCETLPKPHWHPDPGLQTLADRLNCSPLSTLRGGTPEKFPIRWTSVTADCVRYPDQTATDTMCLKKIRNYFYKSLERQYVR